VHSANHVAQAPHDPQVASISSSLLLIQRHHRPNLTPPVNPPRNRSTALACHPCAFPNERAVLDAGDMMPSSRFLPFSTLLLAWASFAAADDTITAGKIKVQLYAAPSFLSEVSVDAYNSQCLSLDNNLYVATSDAMQHTE